MRRNRTISLNLTSLKPHLPIVLCFLVFIIGILLGCLLVGKNELIISHFSERLSVYISVRKSEVLSNIITNSFKNIFPYYFIVFLIGTSVIGSAFAPFVLIYYGFSYGCLSGILYSDFALEGIMLNALVLMPSVLFCAFGLSLLLKDSISFSYLLSGICIKSNKPVNIYTHFRNYCSHGLVTLSAAIIAMVFDVAMSTLFVGYFNI